jgi:hypothetical protein
MDLRIEPGRRIQSWAIIGLLLCLGMVARGQEPAAVVGAPQPEGGTPRATDPYQVVLPESVPDPLEPMNRVVWGFNKALMKEPDLPGAVIE